MMEFDVKEQLDDLSRQERQLRGRHRKTPRDLLGVSRFVLQTALSILSLSNMSYDIATAWIMDRNRKGLKVLKHITSANVKSRLEEIVLEARANWMYIICVYQAMLDQPVAWGMPVTQLLHLPHFQDKLTYPIQIYNGAVSAPQS